MSDLNFPQPQGKTWRTNIPDISSELIGNEVVAIHLPSGRYFSLENAAATVWTGIESGWNFEQLVQALTATYDVVPEQAASDVTIFLENLTRENLIVEARGSNATPPPFVGIPQPYQPPVVEKFADLQDLLRIDPIHEVDQRGWPHVKPE